MAQRNILLFHNSTSLKMLSKWQVIISKCQKKSFLCKWFFDIALIWYFCVTIFREAGFLTWGIWGTLSFRSATHSQMPGARQGDTSKVSRNLKFGHWQVGEGGLEHSYYFSTFMMLAPLNVSTVVWRALEACHGQSLTQREKQTDAPIYFWSAGQGWEAQQLA